MSRRPFLCFSKPLPKPLDLIFWLLFPLLPLNYYYFSGVPSQPPFLLTLESFPEGFLPPHEFRGFPPKADLFQMLAPCPDPSPRSSSHLQLCPRPLFLRGPMSEAGLGFSLLPNLFLFPGKAPSSVQLPRNSGIILDHPVFCFHTQLLTKFYYFTSLINLSVPTHTSPLKLLFTSLPVPCIPHCCSSPVKQQISPSR